MLALAHYTSDQVTRLIIGLFMMSSAVLLTQIHFRARFQLKISRIYLALMYLLLGAGTHIMVGGMLKPGDSSWTPLFMAIAMPCILWCMLWFGRITETVSPVDRLPKKQLVGPGVIYAVALVALFTPFTMLT